MMGVSQVGKGVVGSVRKSGSGVGLRLPSFGLVPSGWLRCAFAGLALV
jgi:hypothetical protein